MRLFTINRLVTKKAAINALLKNSVRLAVIVATLTSANLSHADIYYKWQEANGNWTYGAHPPHGVEAIEVKTSSLGVTTTDNTQATNALSKKSSISDSVAKQHAEYCKTAKANLAALKSDAVIQRRDESGNIVDVSEQEKQLEKENAAEIVKQYCPS